MIRLPDRLYARLERFYRAQTRIRRKELSRELDRQDRAFRAQCDREHTAHDSGLCGGFPNGCRYYPCYSVRD